MVRGRLILWELQYLQVLVWIVWIANFAEKYLYGIYHIIAQFFKLEHPGVYTRPVQMSYPLAERLGDTETMFVDNKGQG